jgi:dTDP-4-dehydrorhamnose 3,5-epimerase
MKATAAALSGLRLVEPDRFGDERGFFSETYNRRQWGAAGIDAEFVMDAHSRSAVRGTVRGLHFQAPPHAQAKLVRVARGAVLDVAVDLRRASPTFGRYLAVELNAENGRQLFIPEGFAHGFCTLAEDTEVLYKLSAYYAPAAEGGIAWDDPELGIAWPVTRQEANLSAKDARLPRLAAADLPDFPFRG